MHRPRPDKLHEELDALLDGRPVELTDELAPLVEAADILRIELAAYQLDAEVADRHLERVLDAPANVVPLPLRRPSNGWDVRRRVVAIALAAALVLAPATIASAASLPGQAMYPFKLAIEQVRLASVQWSPVREAGERTRVADTRRNELERLVNLQMFNQVGPAVLALADAMQAAERAVNEAKAEATGPEVAKLTGQLASVQLQARRTVGLVSTKLQTAALPPSDSTRDEIQAAVQDAQQVLPPAPATAPDQGTATPTTVATPPTTVATPTTVTTTQTTTPTTLSTPTTVTTTQTTTTETTTTTEAADPGTPADGRDGGNPGGTDGTPAADAASENAPPAAAP